MRLRCRRRRRQGGSTQQRMYQLVRKQGPVVDRMFEIELLDREAEAFAFASAFGPTGERRS